MRIWVTRPEPDATATATALASAGHEAWVRPLLRTRLLPIAMQDLEAARAIVVTSRNGVRALTAARPTAACQSLPVFAVGKATATLLREAGFRTVVAGRGTAADLIGVILANWPSSAGPLLYLAGEVVSVDVARVLGGHGHTVVRRTAYAIEPEPAAEAIDAPSLAEARLDAVLLMSVETARAYGRLVDRRELAPAASGLLHACLSEGVRAALTASSVNLTMVKTVVAAAPSLNGILQVLAV